MREVRNTNNTKKLINAEAGRRVRIERTELTRDNEVGGSKNITQQPIKCTQERNIVRNNYVRNYLQVAFGCIHKSKIDDGRVSNFRNGLHEDVRSKLEFQWEPT